MLSIMRLFVTCLATLAFVTLGSGTAGAHTAMTASDPAEGSTQVTVPNRITLTFNEDINATFANVVLNDADGRNWLASPPQVQGPQLSVTLGPDPIPNGVYTVGYRVLSADGHPVSGSYTFTLDAPVTNQSAPNPNTTTTTATAPAAPAQPAPSPADADTGTSTAILLAAVAGVAAGGVIAAWRAIKRRRSARLNEQRSSTDAPTSHEEPHA